MHSPVISSFWNLPLLNNDRLDMSGKSLCHSFIELVPNGEAGEGFVQRYDNKVSSVRPDFLMIFEIDWVEILFPYYFYQNTHFDSVLPLSYAYAHAMICAALAERLYADLLTYTFS